mgnify:CR=1 FL=1
MKRPKVTGLRRRESWQALPFLLPSLLGLCLFYLFPLAETVRASFMDPLRSRAVGWGNYRALFQNTAFRLAPGAAGRQPALCGAAWRGKTAGGLFQKRPPAPLCDSCCQHRCVMEGAFLRQGAGQRLAGGAGVPARGLYGQQRGLLGADFHLPLAKQRVRYAAVAGGSGDHPPALV